MTMILKVVASVALAAAALWTTARVPVTSPPPAQALWGPATAQADRVADTLSARLALGQLIAAPADASGLDALVEAGRIGRVVLTATDVADHLRLLEGWQRMAPVPVHVAAPSDLTLSLPLDDAPALPSATMLAASARPELAFLTGKASASTASTLGIQTPASPLTLAAGTSRFAPTAAGPLERALVQGLRAGQVLPAARLVDASGLDALPGLAAAGLMEVHVRLADARGADLVRQLRGVGAYNGLIVAEVDDRATGAVAALAAGADVVQSSAPRVLHDSLAQGASDGRLAPARVSEASRRVLAAKAWAGLALTPPPAPNAAEGGARPLQISPWRPPSASLVHRTSLLRDEVARRAVTVLQGDDGPLPLVGARAPSSLFTIVLDPDADPDQGLAFTNTLATGLGPATRSSYTRLSLGLGPERYADALDAAQSSEVIVLVLLADADGELAPRHRAFSSQLLSSGRPVLVVSLGPASLAAGLGRPEALVLSYGDSETSQSAAAYALVGQLEVGGRLPLGIAGIAGAGAGERIRQQALRPGTAEEIGLRAETEARIDRVVDAAVQNGAFPGGAVAVGRDGVLLRLKGYGRLTRGGASVTPQTPYDLASLTKVVGTTVATMQLVEEGAIELDTEVVEYLPRYRGLGKEFVTVRQLLEHSAGHRAWYPFWSHDILDRRAALDFIYADTLRYPPGTQSRYSDFDMIVLGEVIQAATDQPLDEVLADRIFEPLGMTSTGFRPVGVVDRTVAPTETDAVWRGRTLQGEVHDEAASVFGGVAGHAGLFSTASDLSRFAYVLANGGRGYGVELFRRTTLDTFTRHVRMQSTYPTALGWMVNAGRGNSSAGSLSRRAFGHTGFTGTSIWVDPDTNVFVVLLTNRVHPSRRNRRIGDARTALASAVADAVQTPTGQPYLAWGFGPLPDDLPDIAQR